MPPPEPRERDDVSRRSSRGDRVIRWGYWIVLALLAVGAARTLWRLAHRFGWM
jgi:hypothetical protein